MERITGADALFLEAETPTMMMHVVGVLVLFAACVLLMNRGTGIRE